MNASSGNTMKAYRERTGATPAEPLRELRKRQATETGAILRAVKATPLTVPEIAAATRLPSPTVVWYVMTLVRAKTLKPVEKTPEGFFRYGLTTTGGR